MIAAALGAPTNAVAATTSVVQLRDESVLIDLELFDECTTTGVLMIGTQSTHHQGGGRAPPPSDEVFVEFSVFNRCDQTFVFLSGDVAVPPGSIEVTPNGRTGSIDATFLICDVPGCSSPSVPVSVSVDVTADGNARLDNIHERRRFPDGSRLQSRLKALATFATPTGMLTIGDSTFSLDDASANIFTHASGSISLTRP